MVLYGIDNILTICKLYNAMAYKYSHNSTNNNMEKHHLGTTWGHNFR